MARNWKEGVDEQVVIWRHRYRGGNVTATGKYSCGPDSSQTQKHGGVGGGSIERVKLPEGGMDGGICPGGEGRIDDLTEGQFPRSQPLLSGGAVTHNNRLVPV